MSDDELKRYRIEFGRLNAGRRFLVDGIERFISAFNKATGRPVLSRDESEVMSGAFLALYGPVSSSIPMRHGDDLTEIDAIGDPIDGLGPLRFPNDMPIKVKPLSPEKEQQARDALRRLAERTTKPAAVVAMTRTLKLLHSLAPLPCWTVEQERELLACGRELAAAIKGGKS